MTDFTGPKSRWSIFYHNLAIEYLLVCIKALASLLSFHLVVVDFKNLGPVDPIVHVYAIDFILFHQLTGLVDEKLP